MSNSKSKLTLNKMTIKALSVRTALRAGVDADPTIVGCVNTAVCTAGCPGAGGPVKPVGPHRIV
jgi:hypothetical protein